MAKFFQFFSSILKCLIDVFPELSGIFLNLIHFYLNFLDFIFDCCLGCFDIISEISHFSIKGVYNVQMIGLSLVSSCVERMSLEVEMSLLVEAITSKSYTSSDHLLTFGLFGDLLLRGISDGESFVSDRSTLGVTALLIGVADGVLGLGL